MRSASGAGNDPGNAAFAAVQASQLQWPRGMQCLCALIGRELQVDKHRQVVGEDVTKRHVN